MIAHANKMADRSVKTKRHTIWLRKVATLFLFHCFMSKDGHHAAM